MSAGGPRPGKVVQPAAVRIEAANERAWHGQTPLALTPRTFAVLRHLVDNTGRLITKDELLAAVWGDVAVSDAALSSCIRDLRIALRDSSRVPRYIETVHRRGFRFIGPVASRAGAAGEAGALAAAEVPARGDTPTPTKPVLVGRSAELALLHGLLEKTAATGQRQLVFVTGEPGIGKTALVEAFLSQIALDCPCLIARGQCVEQYGAGEAYLPFLEALGRLGREPGGERLAETLRQYAPTWLMQLPSLLRDGDLEALERRAQHATRERMLRELVDALEAFGRHQALVLLLEDLHWSDSSTIDVLARWARRREPARVLLLSTYRPADVARSGHPVRAVKQELQVHGQCTEIDVPFLGAAAIAEYLARRFPDHRLPPELFPVLHQSTEGNPLFVVSMVDYLVAQGQIREVDGHWAVTVGVRDIALGTPDTLAQIVDKQVTRLTADEREVLAVASVAGAEFSAAAMAAGGIEALEGERLCEALTARGQFLRGAGLVEWPDGTAAGRYAFIHSLYRRALYERTSIGQRVSLHRRTAELLERAHGERAAEIAGELAMHFEEGRDPARAGRYRRLAAENALRQHGYREAVDHVARALALLEAQPDSAERTREEVALQLMLGSALVPMKGHAAREVEQAYARARELSEQLDDTPDLFPALLRLGWFYIVRGRSAEAREAGQRLSAMAEVSRDAAVDLAAQMILGMVSFYAGEFAAALDHLERGITLYDPAVHSAARSPAFRAILDPGMSCLTHAAWAQWALGHLAPARQRMDEAIARMGAIGHPFSVAQAWRFVAAFHHGRGDRDASYAAAEAGAAVSAEHGFGAVVAAAGFHRGWVISERGQEEEGLRAMHTWLGVCREIRAEALIPTYLGWVADVYGAMGRLAEARELVNEGLAAGRRSGCEYWAAELHRTRGALALLAGAATAEQDAEACFLEAAAIARRQGAKLFELRAATSLARLWARQGRASAAHALLSEIVTWFADDRDALEVAEARALLQDLAAAAPRDPLP